jgi:hypothetical protein
MLLPVKLIVALVLASLPFLGIALLMWKGPKSKAAVLYRAARDRRQATAERVEALHDDLAEADAKLQASQRRLVETIKR